MATGAAPRRFTVDEYFEMARAGILTEDDRVELIDGQIIQMSPIGDPHAEAVNRCNWAFVGLMAAGRVMTSIQNPIRVDRYNDPQPDVVLVPPGLRGAPRVADVLLVIEVADSSLIFDRHTKLPLYARAGIREAWLVDLKAEAVEVHRAPGLGG
ncbi:MAG: Uma2 family endonuclease [Chloroflexota bacterium]|nr:Uma2 family endonuclease [Chloroflexota bacterium]